MPRFSIIVPVYNAERYLEACLGSVAAQTFSDYQVVVVNDGSTDDGPRLCREFCSQQGGKATLIEQPNEGILQTRRTGLRYATGDYVMQLDSDDQLRPDALEVLDRAIAATHADVICFGHSIEPGFSSNDSPARVDAQTLVDDKAQVLERLCCSLDLNAVWDKAIRRECYAAEVDYAEYGRLSWGDDLLQMVDVFDCAQTVLFVPEVLYYYRQNQSSITNTFDVRSYWESVQVMERLSDRAAQWEAVYGGSGWVDAVRAIFIRGTVQMLQTACGTLPPTQAKSAVIEVAESPAFVAAVQSPALSTYMRADLVKIAEMLQKKRYGMASCALKARFSLSNFAHGR